MTAAAINYFAALPALVARLREAMPEGVEVLSASDFEQVKDEAVGRPQVWVFYHSDVVADVAGDRSLIEQRWAVMYVTPTALADLERDGQVLGALTKALAGYDANLPGLSEFQRHGSLVPVSWPEDALRAYGVLVACTLDL